MDTDALFSTRNLFYQGNYKQVVEDNAPANLSVEEELQHSVYVARSLIVLGQAADVAMQYVEAPEPELGIVGCLAAVVNGQDDAVERAEAVIAQYGTVNEVVQVVGATILELAGRRDEALKLLAHHEGSLEAVALMVQLHLANFRSDLALKEASSAKKWSQDSLLSQIAESWVCLRLGGSKYQEAYYIYEELASAPSSVSASVFVGEAIANIHLGQLPEAEAALKLAHDRDPYNPDVLVNMSVLYSLLGRSADAENYRNQLQQIAPSYSMLINAREAAASFDTALAKYSTV